MSGRRFMAHVSDRDPMVEATLEKTFQMRPMNGEKLTHAGSFEGSYYQLAALYLGYHSGGVACPVVLSRVNANDTSHSREF
jgi:hypothetical protein